MSDRVTMDAPTVISFTGEEMNQERDALLLECGSYPDKGLTVTEEDLDGIVSRFSVDGAPIKVEHMDTPLDPLGRVQKVWRDGSVLMAKLLFPEDLSGFLRRRGVQKLSVGLSREAVGLALAEVSLVLKPRVAAAAMFGEDRDPGAEPNPGFAKVQDPTPGSAKVQDPTPGFAVPSPLRGEGLVAGSEGERPTPRHVATLPKGEGLESEKDWEIARLSAALTAREVEGQIASLKAAGRVVPATESLVRALLSVPHNALVTLAEADGALPVSKAFLSYLEASPPVVQFMETAGDKMHPDKGARTHHHAQGDLAPLTPDEEAFLKKLGLNPADVQHMMRHGKLPTK